jgi:hypothetical protein
MGTTYEIGEIIDDFKTRCGNAQEYPCYCDPSLDPPISCPYCSFVQPNDGLLCLSDGETKTFVDDHDQQQTCSCTLDRDGRPESFCDDVPNVSVSETTTTISQSGTCTLDLPGGGTFTFQRGESIDDVLPNRCGENFPCFCNPDIPGNIECPYCRFVNEDGDLLCAGDGETVSFRDEMGEQQSCFCDIPVDPTRDPIPSCTTGSTTGGSDNSNDDRFNDDQFGNNDDVTDDRFGNNDDFSDDLFGNNDENGSDDVCTLELDSGDIITFARGESYGDYIETRCGSSIAFPCYCNPDITYQMECPYCGFVQGDGELLCAKHQEVVSFNDGVEDVTCSCEIPIDPLEEPIKSCGQGDIPPGGGENDNGGCSIMDEDGFMVDIPEGESFGNLVEGVCGDPNEWPAFCNTDPENTVVSRQGSQEFDFVEYPYCVYSDTRAGDTLCAKDGEEVVYINDFGDEVQCTCSYVEMSLGGAQSTCETLDGDPSPSQPTDPTVSPPTFSPVPNSASSPNRFSAMTLATGLGSLVLLHFQ